MNNKSLQHGIGLIEVLVSTIIIAVGVLGVLGMQTRALQLNQGSMHMSQAVVLANDMLDRMRANKNSANAYIIGFNDPVPVSGINCGSTVANCSPTEMAAYDLEVWRNTIETILPLGQSSVRQVITGGARPVYIVRVRFDDGRLEGNATGTGYRVFSIRSEI